MTQYYSNKPETVEDGFKCTACGATWSVKNEKTSICPSCGYTCNAYVCQVIDPTNKQEASTAQHGEQNLNNTGYKCTACGHVWKTTDIKDSCPSCGYACNAYVCQRVTTEDKE